MGIDELRLRMLLEHVVLLGDELLEGRELVGRARALGELLELEPALVVDVLGLEEGLLGSAVWISTGMPSSPHFAQTGSIRGSSTGTRFPEPSTRVIPRLL